LGEAKLSIPEGLAVDVSEGLIKIKRLNEERKTRTLHGTFSRLVANAIKGTSDGFCKTLEVVGAGYRAQMEGQDLVLSLGFSHSVRVCPPAAVKIETQENKIKIFGTDKEQVGLVADKIRKLKKPDPYKGKGVRYFGEKLKLKPGKAVAKVGAPAVK